jgi:uncharacterized protein YyaL (SSP411 family)
MNKTPNRLINEKSPYLLQHAWNPVEWYPWGKEAFRKAHEEDLPIFLSSGYATCHWCHVMERESFENPDTAEFINRNFVPVKLDREEHPDIDRIYMLFVVSFSGKGGWPMSVWLTPDLKPFFGGSYFPDTKRWGMTDFRSILDLISRIWKFDRQKLLTSANSAMEQLTELTRPVSPTSEVINDRHATSCLAELQRDFDAQWGGFGDAPKFPRPPVISFLFSHAVYTGNSEAADMAFLTLRKMAEGGIHDQLGVPGKGGGGFCRYSTDRYWQVPHFEKMLYDNALLATSYLEAYQLSEDAFFADTARDIFNYVLCDLTSPEGAFWSAEDADSIDSHNGDQKREGAFYLWTEQEITDVLDPAESSLFLKAYGISSEGNIPGSPGNEFADRNILIRSASGHELAMRFGLPVTMVTKRLESARLKLFEARNQRPHPDLDDTIISSWNGMMISSLARGSLILRDEKLLNAANRAATFIIDTLFNPVSGPLLRRYRDGEAAIDGKAADYASMIQGLIDLYQASFDPRWLKTAIRLMDSLIDRFYEKHEGGFYCTAFDDLTLPIRMIENNDGAEPSPSSIATMNLLRLSAITGRRDLHEIALNTIRYFSHLLNTHPSSVPLMIAARNITVSPPHQIIYAGDRQDPAMRSLVSVVFRRYRPSLTILHAEEARESLLNKSAKIGRTHTGKPTAYLCTGGRCLPGLTDPEELETALSGLK